MFRMFSENEMVDGHSLSLSGGDVAWYHVTLLFHLLPNRRVWVGGYVIGFLEGEEHIQSGRTYFIHSDNLST
jgi:hypothetical protein